MPVNGRLLRFWGCLPSGVHALLAPGVWGGVRALIFTSTDFLFVFLPVVWLIYLLLAQLKAATATKVQLVLASVLFYVSWNASYLPILLGSVVFNYFLARMMMARGEKWMLWLGIVANLSLLGVYKYADFTIGTLDTLFGADIPFVNIALPLAISFYTFQQIAYLVDTWEGKIERITFFDYLLFVCFFPQFIAGPIVHHSEMMPQFTSGNFLKVNRRNLAAGLAFFAIGFLKKTMLADPLAGVANEVFAREAGFPLSMPEAWFGAIAYTLQIYFDFSGYSDMAVGLGRLFGINLPYNFNSPYKSASIIDFWRRWHMTLSRFLRDYLYFPLGGNRKGVVRRYLNLMIVMLLGGLWHGAAWTFVVWGGLHGLYLMLNHGWIEWVESRIAIPAPLKHVGGVAITFLMVAVAWVFFRAPTFDRAFEVLRPMFGMTSKPGSLYEG
ncbi:MBOAT family O-acyltransferase [Methyloligella solikamskensis]|uniref:Probable alginate O-acetylase AlgI n=1 Tax=Methyloligella solikamskensis TaxID=1177756 RepID=A0ABW3JCA0_9HYPH